MRVKLKTFVIFALVLLIGVGHISASAGRSPFERVSVPRMPAPHLSRRSFGGFSMADVMADFRQHVEREHETRFFDTFRAQFRIVSFLA